MFLYASTELYVSTSLSLYASTAPGSITVHVADHQSGTSCTCMMPTITAEGSLVLTRGAGRGLGRGHLARSRLCALSQLPDIPAR